MFRFHLLLGAWALLGLFLFVYWPRIATSRAWQVSAMAGVIVLAVVHMWVYSTLADDAFITFRYSMNLAQGHGAVFNQGEKVEGYSNFLWMIVLAGLHALFSVNIVTTARLLGMACAAAALVVSYLLVRRISGNGAAGVLAAAVTASAGCFAAYGPAGLETPLFVLLVLGMLWFAVAWPLWTGVLGALTMMTRPEGVVIVGVFGMWLLLRAWRCGIGWRPLAWFTGAVLAVAGPWEIWRIVYYGGYLLPNAVAAKGGGSLAWQVGTSGWGYFVRFLGAYAVLLILVPVAVYLLVVRRAKIPAAAAWSMWLLFGLSFAYTTFVILTGGDWMPAWRMLVMPLAVLSCGVFSVGALVGGHVTEPSLPTGRATALLAAAVSLVMLSSTVTNSNQLPRVQLWHQEVVDLGVVGDWFHNTLPEGTVVATYANGALSYHAGTDITMIDELGLTDEHIARHGYRWPTGTIGHLAYDFGYIVNDRKPGIVVTSGGGFYARPTCAVKAPYRADYVGVVYQYVGHRKWMTLYLRKDEVNQMEGELSRDSAFKLVACPG